MVKRVLCFLVVLMLISLTKIFAQAKQDSVKAGMPFSLTQVYSMVKNPVVIKPAFYAEHLSFFCRKELQIEKITAMPLRFRLGSKEYTDYLEQKPNAKRLR